ncbi:MAG: hypothetical protein AVDCRST_MAG54-1893 [uncultured Actinomycetospora sp.]|uniref:Uncharacterized protein n=1 Tax=uncultured Actinomycetospora sp. TaxID=1135996 RepID=A0A6J4IFR3_9PSEU|nr:MAG: hypothetical protein AVDCRST_MAG54-1893 [uncultured Actinomycetospora sp.]
MSTRSTMTDTKADAAPTAGARAGAGDRPVLRVLGVGGPAQTADERAW